MIGIHPIFGAFAFGVALSRAPWQELRLIVLRPPQDIARLLLPVYFVIVGLSVNIGSLRGGDWAVLALLLGVARTGKLLGATLPARLTGLLWRESVGVGFLMNTRGLTELIILNVSLNLGVLDGRLFTLMVLVALITTALAGPMLPRLIKKPPPAAATASAGSPPAHSPAPEAGGGSGKISYARTPDLAAQPSAVGTRAMRDQPNETLTCLVAVSVPWALPR